MPGSVPPWSWPGRAPTPAGCDRRPAAWRPARCAGPPGPPRAGRRSRSPCPAAPRRAGCRRGRSSPWRARRSLCSSFPSSASYVPARVCHPHLGNRRAHPRPRAIYPGGVTSHVRPRLATLGFGAALAALVLMTAGVLFSGAVAPTGVLDPGAVVRWGVPVVTVLTDAATAVTLGALALCAVVLPWAGGGEGRRRSTTDRKSA